MPAEPNPQHPEEGLSQEQSPPLLPLSLGDTQVGTGPSKLPHSAALCPVLPAMPLCDGESTSLWRQQLLLKGILLFWQGGRLVPSSLASKRCNGKDQASDAATIASDHSLGSPHRKALWWCCSEPGPSGAILSSSHRCSWKKCLLIHPTIPKEADGTLFPPLNQCRVKWQLFAQALPVCTTVLFLSGCCGGGDCTKRAGSCHQDLAGVQPDTPAHLPLFPLPGLTVWW